MTEEADIIRPLTSDPNGVSAHVWIEAIEITRRGNKPIPGLTDKWAFSFPLRASLGIGDALQLDLNGNEITTTCPLTSVRADVADYIHHPEVAELIQKLRSVAIKITTGELAPMQA